MLSRQASRCLVWAGSTVPDLGKPEASETQFEAPSRILIIDTGGSTHILECLRKKQARAFTAQANWQCSGEQRPLLFFPLGKHVFSDIGGGG